jgi:hypothetical protein
MKYSAGTLAHDKLMRSIELYGRDVIPRVRELLGTETARTAEPRQIPNGAEFQGALNSKGR